MAQLLEFKCPSCGGAINFDSQAQRMKCPYCDTEFEMDAVMQHEEALRSESVKDDFTWDVQADSNWQEDELNNFAAYVCQSCGGQIVGDFTTAATSCPYCDNPVVIAGNISGDLRPDYIIPFKLTKEQAKQGLRNHIKGKRLLPKQFKDENHIDKIRGMYVPFWLFDTKADAKFRYRATQTSTWSDSNYIYTKTSYYSILRSGNIDFSSVPVDASSQMADDLMESIEPYNVAELTNFHAGFLAGYLADRYDVPADQCIERANHRVRQSTENQFRSTVRGYATVVQENGNIQLSDGKANYVLYPVWVLNTSWGGEQFTFAMNGQTGRFIGDLPLDKKAYWKWFGLIALIVAALAYAAAWLFLR
ncbi:MAG: hypothetical protein GX328_01080 [Clostridiaceae bacterium]|nr:hypothetical protein [Clostridiaceae bacterium]